MGCIRIASYLKWRADRGKPCWFVLSLSQCQVSGVTAIGAHKHTLGHKNIQQPAFLHDVIYNVSVLPDNTEL